MSIFNVTAFNKLILQVPSDLLPLLHILLLLGDFLLAKLCGAGRMLCTEQRLTTIESIL